MSSEVKSGGTQSGTSPAPIVATAVAAIVEAGDQSKAEEPNKSVDVEEEKNKEGKVMDKAISFKEESNFLSDLTETEKKALNELRDKVEDAILTNTLFPEEAEKEKDSDTVKEVEEEKNKEENEKVAEEEEKKGDKEKVGEEKKENKEKVEEKTVEGKTVKEEKVEVKEKEAEEKKVAEEKMEGEEVKVVEEMKVDRDILLWGVPLLPSEGSEATNVILLKFLRARDFKSKDAFEMLKRTLQWRRENKIDTILEEEIPGADHLRGTAYMDTAIDREGHPICYNVYGVFADQELYSRMVGSEAKTEQFLRWGFQVMEKGIQRLDFSPGSAASILQITDLKNAPWISKKELRLAMSRAVNLLQDNYPEFVAKNIFINVPFWYYAFNTLLSPFLTQRTKSKFVFARPAKVTETLLKYLEPTQIPVQYGGLRRQDDTKLEGKEEATVCELSLKAGGTEHIEIPVKEVGINTFWEISVVGWDVDYKEEFVPDNAASYTVIVLRGKKYSATHEAHRNSFKNQEPGKLVLTIENNTYKVKKVLYRYGVM